MKKQFIEFVKKRKFVLDVVAFLYSIIHGSNIWRYVFREDVKFRGAFLNNTHIYVHKGCKLFIGSKCQMNHCRIDVWGGKVHVDGSQTCINNTRFILRDSACSISIGSDFSMQGGNMQCAEGKAILIGKHCMFSGDVEISSTDLHPIYAIGNGEIINKGKDVIISDHVWIGAHVRVLKGASIASDSIIGNSSVVSGNLTEANTIYAGVPARRIKTGINWARSIEEISEGL
jgi:acetyltransferase-like isoleucine patch superfamily enzyme